MTPIRKQLDKNLRKVQGIPVYLKDEDESFHNWEVPIIIVHNGTDHFAPCTITNRQKLNNVRIQYLLVHISDAVKLKDSITFKDLPNKIFCQYVFTHLGDQLKFATAITRGSAKVAEFATFATNSCKRNIEHLGAGISVPIVEPVVSSSRKRSRSESDISSVVPLSKTEIVSLCKQPEKKSKRQHIRPYNSSKFKCTRKFEDGTFCSYTWGRKHMLVTHLRVECDGEFCICEICIKNADTKDKGKYRSPQSLKRHIRTDHENNYRKQCKLMKQKDDGTMEKCSFGCYLQEQLDRHHVKEHGVGQRLICSCAVQEEHENLPERREVLCLLYL